MEVVAVAGVAWFAGDEVTRRRGFGGGGSGRFRQLQRGETRGKGSEGCRGSRSRGKRAGDGLYLANSGEPKRRSSSSISSSGGSGEELGVQGDDLVVQRASGEERRARGGP